MYVCGKKKEPPILIDMALIKIFMTSQSLVKERDEAGLKKNSAAVHKFIEELVKIGKVSLVFFICLKVATWIGSLLF